MFWADFTTFCGFTCYVLNGLLFVSFDDFRLFCLGNLAKSRVKCLKLSENQKNLGISNVPIRAINLELGRWVKKPKKTY